MSGQTNIASLHSIPGHLSNPSSDKKFEKLRISCNFVEIPTHAMMKFFDYSAVIGCVAFVDLPNLNSTIAKPESDLIFRNLLGFVDVLIIPIPFV